MVDLVVILIVWLLILLVLLIFLFFIFLLGLLGISDNQIWCNVFYVLRSSGKNIRSLEEDRNMDQSDGSDWSIFKFEEIFCVQFLRMYMIINL